MSHRAQHYPRHEFISLIRTRDTAIATLVTNCHHRLAALSQEGRDSVTSGHGNSVTALHFVECYTLLSRKYFIAMSKRGWNPRASSSVAAPHQNILLRPRSSIEAAPPGWVQTKPYTYSFVLRLTRTRTKYYSIDQDIIKYKILFPQPGHH